MFTLGNQPRSGEHEYNITCARIMSTLFSKKNKKFLTFFRFFLIFAYTFPSVRSFDVEKGVFPFIYRLFLHY